MNLRNCRLKIAMLGVIACLLLALGVAIGIASAANPAMASPPVLHVKPTATGSGNCTDWANACTLQHALDSALAGDEIWVATGVYTPTNVIGREATFQLKSGVAMYGGFDGLPGTEGTFSQRDWESNITVLSGDIDNDDITDPNGVITTTANITGTNSYHVMTSTGVTETTVLDGFTITGGNANGDDPHDAGGGMRNDDSSPTLVNVTFSGNSATSYGGGMLNSNSSPTLTNVTFSGNSATDFGGGMENYPNSSPTLTNVTFSGNSASEGGGMENWNNSSPALTNVTFSGNSANLGGGMNNYSDSSPALTNVTFRDNSASEGGGMESWDSSPTLVNVTFSGNSADHYGGGMVNASSSPTLTNVTFSGNSAGEDGAGMANQQNSNPTLANCILWGNTAPQIYNDSTSSATVTYSDIQDGYTGDGNIAEDPEFVDPDGPDDTPGTLDDNLRLQDTSPAIDAGDNTADLDGTGPGTTTIADVATDLDGYPRCVDVPSIPDTGVGPAPIVDMGAYEAQLKVYLPLVLKSYAP